MLPISVSSSILIALLSFAGPATSGDSIADLPKKAIERSQITAPGSHPFVLKAKLLEITNPANTNYQAEIEEHWAAPDKWRRMVRTSSFSETLIVNGDKTSEEITGDYYPNWLRTLVTGIFDPGKELQGVDLWRSNESPRIGVPEFCRRFTYMAGLAPVSNKVFSNYCFLDGLVESIQIPGFSVSYKDYKNFAGKRVAHTITEFIESGTEVQAKIVELSELKSPDEAMFSAQEASAPLKTIRTDEQTLRSLAVNAPDVVWPTVRSGALTGTLSLYVCLDRSGRVREIYELNSSNPGLSDVARDQVMKWHFKTATNQGAPVQVESILTFAFNSAIADPIPVLEGQEGEKFVLARVEPVWPAGFAPAGTPVIVTIGVNENGESRGLVFVTSDAANQEMVTKKIPMIEIPLQQALKQWRFQPYIRNGKATEYQAKFTLFVN
jgi:hypothetical protein